MNGRKIATKPPACQLGNYLPVDTACRLSQTHLPFFVLSAKENKPTRTSAKMRNGLSAIACVALGAIVLLLSACSSLPSSGAAPATRGRAEFTDDFKNGDARLECQLSCSLTWGLYRDRAKALYNAKAWND